MCVCVLTCPMHVFDEDGKGGLYANQIPSVCIFEYSKRTNEQTDGLHEDAKYTQFQITNLLASALFPNKHAINTIDIMFAGIWLCHNSISSDFT